MSLRRARTFGLAMAIVLATVPGAQAEICPAAAVAQATMPAPPRDPLFLAETDDLLRDAPRAVDVLVLGDSLVKMWPTDLLRSLFPGQAVFRFGVSGDRTQNVLWRLARPEIQRLQPKTFVLLVGTNNLEDGDPACAILAGIDAIVRRLDGGGPRPDLRIVQVLPRGEAFAFRDADRRAVNRGIEALVRRRGGAVAIGVDQEITCGMRRTCDTFRADALHLEDSGYVILSEALRRG